MRSPQKPANPFSAIATHMAAALRYLLNSLLKLTAEITLGCVNLVAYLITISIIAALAVVYLNYAVVLLKRLFDADWMITPELLPSMIQPIALCYLSASLLTIYFYRQDKQAAQKGAWRTPEMRLHQLEFLGGWLGAFIAQQLFRHKTSKQSFQLTFNLIVIFHLATLANLFLFQGQYLWINLILLCVVLFQMNNSKYSKPRPLASQPPKLKPRHQHPIIRK
jgi:uncharacterized membrane protein YsdA (DUF1294 family)